MINSIDSIMYNLSLLNERNQKVNTGLSTQEALEYGSDDAMKYNYILGIQSDINTFNSIDENITLSAAFNSTSDDALAEAKNTVETIIAQIIKSNTSNTDDQGKLVIADEVETYKDTLLSLANSKVNGQYVFSGINTDMEPFTKDPITGQISYQSDNSTKKVNVEVNTYSPQGVNGIEAFYYKNQDVTAGNSFTFDENEIILDENGNQWKLMDTDNDNIYDGLYLNGDATSTPIAITDNGDGTYTATNSTSTDFQVKHSIFDDIDEFVAALKYEDTDGNTISATDADAAIKKILNNFQDSGYDALNIAHSNVGNRSKTIETYGDIVSSKLTNLKVLETEYASADLTALAVESKAIESTYTAIYSVIQRVNNLSLVNYLN